MPQNLFCKFLGTFLTYFLTQCQKLNSSILAWSRIFRAAAGNWCILIVDPLVFLNVYYYKCKLPLNQKKLLIVFTATNEMLYYALHHWIMHTPIAVG